MTLQSVWRNEGLERWLNGKSTYYSYKGPGFDSQHPCGSLQLSDSSLIPSSELHGCHAQVQYTDANAGKKCLYILKINNYTF